MPDRKPALLCVANFPANTGYAWDFIEHLYARIADHLHTHQFSTLVAYPAISSPPRTLAASAARPIVVDAGLETRASVRAMSELIRRENVHVIYFTDRPSRHWSYLQLRKWGVRRIIVHDHTSGDRTRPRALKRAAKWVLARVPGIAADVVVTVSDYVARRQMEIGLIPPTRVYRVWNGLPHEDTDSPDCGHAYRIFGVETQRPLVLCASRASPEKGVAHLLRSFNSVVQDLDSIDRRPFLIYLGDGPQLGDLRSLWEALPAKADIVLAGYRPDAPTILRSADICVVPSVWQEAFPLAVLEAMARAKPVIATRVGGIPEMIDDGKTGLLVPPADEVALAQALRQLLADPLKAADLGKVARQVAAERFTLDRQILELLSLVEEGFGPPCASVRDGRPKSKATSSAPGPG